MSMLLFMPWCPIDNSYRAGEISIMPYERHTPIEGLDDAGQCQINTIMGIYKDIEGKPVHKAAILRYGSKSLVENLVENEIETAQDLLTLVCFSGLAKRKFFNLLGPYCNSDCFSFYIQKFDKADFTALQTRRREGRTLSGWPIDEISITIPMHCHTIREVSLDTTLLDALINHRVKLNNAWGRWQNAISCFNQANTDSDNIRYQIEWVLLCSAFEHLLAAKSNAKDVACKFTKTFNPSEELLAKDSTRLSGQCLNGNESIRYKWIREFYRIRGDFAHGKLNTQKPIVWNPLEHLVLASIAFPLVIKSLQCKARQYTLTDEDQAQIDSFEKFSDTVEFLRPPSNRSGSLDSHWGRLVSDHFSEITFKRASEKFFKNRTAKQLCCLEEAPNEEDE